MTDTDLLESTAVSNQSASAQSALTAMLLPQLRSIATQLGIKGTSGMRKGELIDAIRDGAATSDSGKAAAPAAKAAAPDTKSAAPASESTKAEPSKADPAQAEPKAEPTKVSERADSGGATAAQSAPQPDKTSDAAAESGPDQQSDPTARRVRNRRGASRAAGAPEGGAAEGASAEPAAEGASADKAEDSGSGSTAGANSEQSAGENRRNQNGGNQNGGQRGNNGNNGGDDEEGGRGRRGRRFRERRRGRDRGAEGAGGDTEVREDDVLQPVVGILDVLDNYAFVRTTGYLAGPNDVYVSMNLVRKNGLRRGDVITGAVRAPRDGDQSNQRQKFDPLVRLDTVNGGDVEAARKRPDFGKLTPLYPNERLRLETTKEKLSTRVIDLIMPIGKGQRALIVSPPKAGKTTIIQDIANAIATNNPECHLMVVLVDERPEEVTDMQRSVKGEVIASTFDRPPSDHTSVSELAIERAKRLVEAGKDVVVLLDSITRLGRAYNNSSPASGRILSGGVDSTALYPPKRFLGAARNIENGGSLTIIASALVETGSTGDTVIFEEFKGTGNAELKLDRKIADRRVFPAVDVNLSSTRKDDLLMSSDEFAIVHKLRRVLSGLDSHQAIDLLIAQLRKTRNNLEFLMQVSKNAPGGNTDD